MRYLTLLVIICLFAFCNPPEYDKVPQIEFVSFSPNIIEEPTPGSGLDSTFLIISFQDGDGNIGHLGNVNTDLNYLSDTLTGCIIGATGEGLTGNYDTVAANFFLTDRRTGCTEGYNIPNVEPKSSEKAISGEIELIIAARFCRFMLPPLETDTLIYDIYIEDREGNRSNVATTTPLYINCNN